MQGWHVVTSDGKKLGHVVGEQGEFLIVEHGTLKHTKHALPKAYVTPKPESEELCVGISKDLLYDSPKVNGTFDEIAVANYYGVVAPGEDEPTRGYGDTISDADPSWTADQAAAAAGVKPAEQERAEIRTGVEETEEPTSPALLGDRAPERQS
jgi:hypothetical protein